MGRKKKVKCSQCSQPLFYLPSNYTMGVDIVCIKCADGKSPPKTKRQPHTAAGRYARTVKGQRPDLGKDYFRSSTEANFARILVTLELQYEYEKRTFFYHDEKRKPHQYTPDFEIKDGNEKFPAGWYEIKGYMDSKSRQKLRRLKKHYPDDAKKMIVVLYRKSDKKATEFCEKAGFRYMYYDELTKEYSSDIPTWE